MSQGNAIVQAYDENILLGITPTGTAPSTSYTLTTFLTLNPATRILYSATSITLTWTRGVAAEGAILVIPCSNLEGTVAVLTTNTGLNVSAPAPVMTRNRIPKTLVLDFSSALLAQRTATTWTLTITGNVANVVFGGVIAIYGPKGQLQDTNFMFGSIEKKTAAVLETKNTYLTRYRQVLRTQERVITILRIMSQVEEAKFSGWYDANFGMGYPSLLWPYPAENDAYFGTWPVTYERSVWESNPLQGRLYQVTLEFSELSKGQPV